MNLGNMTRRSHGRPMFLHVKPDIRHRRNIQNLQKCDSGEGEGEGLEGRGRDKESTQSKNSPLRTLLYDPAVLLMRSWMFPETIHDK